MMTSEKYKRPLNQREADRCEQAEEPVCKCRCGGAKHGAKRVPAGSPAAAFATLPPDDPHYIPLPKKRMSRSEVRAEIERMRFENGGDA
jgi:hypothetical protein